MSNNLIWLTAVFSPFIIALILWLLLLHERPKAAFIVLRDSAFSDKVAEIYYQDEAFYFRPLAKNLLLKFKPIDRTTRIQEDDQIVIGHTIFQVRQLDGWTPHLRTVGYYMTDRDLSNGVSVGRSIHSEELNNWEINDIIVKDSTFEPVHFMIFPSQNHRYRIKSLGKKGVYIPYIPSEDEKQKKDSPEWFHLTTQFTLSDISFASLRKAKVPEAILKELSVLKGRKYANGQDFLRDVLETIGNDHLVRYKSFIARSALITEAILKTDQRIKVNASVFELTPIKTQEALALKIIRGVRPAYKLSREARNIIGGLKMTPKEYIPDYLVDEEFIEYVRQAIEHGLFYLDDPATREGSPRLQVKGFDSTGRLIKEGFAELSSKEKFLLHNVFRFREQEGVALRWRRPFNREAEDSYKFYPEQIENFIIDPDINQVKNIYRYAARLTNPHTIAEEVVTERGEICDRDRKSHARLWVYSESSKIPPNPPLQKGETKLPIAELLLVPSSSSDTVLSFNTKEALDNGIYVAGGYQFSEGTSVVYEQGTFQKLAGETKATLRDGDTFTDGQYIFRYAAPGKGLLAMNRTNGKTTRRYYPLGSRLAHIVGYSYAKSQFKGNIERVFDKVLLGEEKKKPWWSLKRTIERTSGNNLILTIDDDLQRVVYAELNEKLDALNERNKTDQFKGAAIVINAEGEILASATIPSYNPNDIHSILQALNESDEDHWNSSYINRATHKSYPPGSTMKVIMSTIALDNKEKFLRNIGNGQYAIKDGNRNFVCTGWLDSFQGRSFGRYGIPDFGGQSHGEMNLDRALTVSCNNTFAFLALNAGWEMIQGYAERYGFNQQFDFLPYEMFKSDVQLVSNINRELRDPLASLSSQVPTPKELKITQLARMGIGQWEILATPLQMATVAMTVGNFGLRPYPHLVRGIEDRTAGEIRYLPYPKKQQVFSAQIFAELFPMMQHVVQMGSGVRMTRSTIPYYSLKDHVAGKTGTAEVEDQSGRKDNVVWFISFAPIENPQVAIAVVIEKGQIISGEAVEVARGIWEKAVLLYPELFQL
jgi:cell division protein FtsI/penicillin-binding protein 2